jgi:hypothetical protein
MALSLAPVERQDPSTSNLRGFLLFFVLTECLYIPYCVYESFRQFAVVSRETYLRPSTITYQHIEGVYAGALAVASTVGVFLILVRDPRTRRWWIALTSSAAVIDAAHVWLVRHLLDQPHHAASDILVRHGFLGAVIWLAYWTLSARVKIAFGSHYAQPPISYNVLGAAAVFAILIVLLAMGAGSLA